MRAFTHSFRARQVLGAAGLVLAVSWGPAASAQQALDVTIRGGPASGLYQLVGEGLSGVLRQALPNSRISYEPGSPAGNAIAVVEGKTDVGLSDSIDLKGALNGTPPFKEKLPADKVRAIARLFDTNLMQIFMRAEVAERYGIKTLADFPVKKPPLNVSINSRGNVENQTMIRELFKAYGFTPEDFEKWGGKLFFENSGGTLNLMRDRKVDLFPVGLFAPDSRFIDLHRNAAMTLLPMGADVVTKLAKEWGLALHTIPADAYPFIDKPYPTFGFDAMLVVRADMPEEKAYQLTKALGDNIDKVRAIHKGFSQFSLKQMAGVEVTPYHAGALRYFKEKGIATGGQ